MVRTVIVERRVYLSHDGRAVPRGPEAARLLFTKGQEIDIRTAEKFGLVQHRDPTPIHRDHEPVVSPAPPYEPKQWPKEPEVSDELTAPVKRRGRPPKSRV